MWKARDVHDPTSVYNLIWLQLCTVMYSVCLGSTKFRTLGQISRLCRPPEGSNKTSSYFPPMKTYVATYSNIVSFDIF